MLRSTDRKPRNEWIPLQPVAGEVGPSHCTLLNRFISKRKIKEDKRIEPQLPADRTTFPRSIRSGEGGGLQIAFRRIFASDPPSPRPPPPNHHFRIAKDAPRLHADFNLLPKRTRIPSIRADRRKRRIAVVIIIITRSSRSKSPAVE